MIRNWKFVTILCLMVFVAPQNSEAENILAFLPTFSPSHLIIEMAAVNAMAERHHNVTVVSVLPLESDWLHPHITHIQLQKGSVDLDYVITITKMKGFEKLQMLQLLKYISSQLALIMEDQKFQELLHNPGNKYDLMMYGYLFSDYFLGIAEHFDCPVALLWPNILTSNILNMIGSPLEISYTVLTILSTTSEDSMGFMFRLKNVLHVGLDLFIHRIQDAQMGQIYAESFPPDKYASYDKAKERVAMVLFSHHFSEKPIRPLVPAVIEIGGIHINDPPKNLSKDIADFINSAEHGVIFFSMGTNVKEHHMQPKTLDKIYNVLSILPHKVIWKVDDESKVPGNSSHILYSKWLPQSDILGHTNVKLFFGHGGKGGITEAEYYGVPMVVLPIFADQPNNMNEIVKKGYGLSIDHEKPLTEEIISKTVSEVLENPFYANNVKKFSMLYRDRPLKAKENAVYWLEYLLRYKGAPHIQSPLRTMSFVEAMNLDVFAFLLIALFIVVQLMKLFLKCVVTLIARLLKKNKHDNDIGN